MKTSKKIFKNIFSLTVAEAANKGIAFITAAYLARVIMPEGFGVIGFANSFIIYFLLFVNLGFNAVGTRDVAKNFSLINKYVNSIVTIRVILSIIAYMALFITVIFLDKPLEIKYALWIIGFNLFSNAILLDWIFQAVEKMEILAIRQIITALLNLIGTIILVTSPTHTVIAIAVTVVTTAINSIWMFLLYMKMYGKYKIDFDWKLVKEMLKSSIPITFMVVFANLYTSINVLLVGIMRGEAETGFYFACFKLLQIMTLPTIILQGAFFPVISRSESITDRDKIVSKYSIMLFFTGAIVSVMGYFYADFLISVIFGSNYQPSIIILKIVMVTNFLVYLTAAFGQPLIAWKKEKYVMYLTALGAVANLVANFILIPKFGATGAAFATIISEFTVGFGCACIFYKIMKKLYLLKLLKSIFLALISGFTGFLLYSFNLNIIVCIIFTLILYFIVDLIMKTFSIDELKAIFVK